jgi:hypothetical protein
MIKNKTTHCRLSGGMVYSAPLPTFIAPPKLSYGKYPDDSEDISIYEKHCIKKDGEAIIRTTKPEVRTKNLVYLKD